MAAQLAGDFETRAVSTLKSQPLRLADITLKTLSEGYDFIAVDVYSTKAFVFAEVASLLAAFRKKKIVLVLHGGALPDLYERQPERVKRVFDKAWKIVSPSNYLKDFFDKKGFQVDIIPNSVNTEIFRYNRDNVKPCSLLWVRAFKDIYNPDIPVKVVALLKDKFPDITLTMVGPDDGMLAQCKALANQLGVSNKIEFIGRINNTQLPQYYQTHSIYLNTTTYESFGVAVVEAAMCGIPVISSNVGEIPFMWQNGKNIITVDSIIAENYVTGIEKLFQNPELAKQQVENALQNTRKFNWEEIKMQWLKLFQVA